MVINPPQRSKDDTDRFLDAREAVEDGVIELVEKVMEAGWSEREAVAAIANVAKHRLVALSENDFLEELFKNLSKR
jgi:hypothetical protein